VRWLAAGVIAVCIVALGACGGDGPAIDAKGAELLQAEVAAARSAVARGNGPEATEMLKTVDRTVDALRRQNKITDSRAAEVHHAVDEVRAALLRSVAPTTVTNPPATVAPVPATEPDVRRGEDDNANFDDKGKGKGHGPKRDKRDG
jgi:hypothetical protein